MKPVELTTEVTFWDCDKHACELQHYDAGDAIYDALEKLWDNTDSYAAFWASLPEKMQVHGFAKSKIDYVASLEDFSEYLDRNYRNHEALDVYAPSDKAKEAFNKFLDIVIQEFEVYNCEYVYSEDFDPRQWIKENCPEWGTDEE